MSESIDNGWVNMQFTKTAYTECIFDDTQSVMRKQIDWKQRDDLYRSDLP